MSVHLICERDVGLFSLIQQVISNTAWALFDHRTPIVHFQDRTCYWTPKGYHGKENVWEYYFEPLVPSYPASSIPEHVRRAVQARFPTASEVGYALDDEVFVSAHFGDHPELEGKSLWIPWQLEDPDAPLRWKAKRIIRKYVRPRAYIRRKVGSFFARRMKEGPVIGIHARGTDAISAKECRSFRHGSLNLSGFETELRRLLEAHPGAKIFVATDDQSTLAFFQEKFGDRVIAYDSLRHEGGEAAGAGPTGWLMPAYIAADRDRAARNGEEAVIEYLLLSRCDHLVHNGGSLARTVLLNSPRLPHTNTHRGQPGLT